MDDLVDLDLEQVETVLKETKKSDKHRKSSDQNKHKRKVSRSRSNNKYKDRSSNHHGSKRSKRRSRSRSKSSRSYKRLSEKEIQEKLILEKQQRDLQAIQDQLIQAQKQQEEAQRDECTITILQLKSKIDEQQLYQFFTKHQTGKIRDIRMIRDKKTGKSKGIAYVEFYEASAALKSMALSGIEIEDFPCKIIPSQADKNRTAAASKQLKMSQVSKNQIIEKEKLSQKIYVSNMIEELAILSESDLSKLFEPFGDIEYIDLFKKGNGENKGYAFICYKDSRDAKAAVHKMNNFTIKGRRLKVMSVENNQNLAIAASMDKGTNMDLDENGNIVQNAQGRALLMQKLNEKNNQQLMPGMNLPQLPNLHLDSSIIKLGLGIPNLADNPLFQTPQLPVMTIKSMPNTSQISTNYILITNMFTRQQISDHNFLAEIQEDIMDECKTFGQVEKLQVDVESDGFVWVKYAEIDQAMAAQDKFSQIYFLGRKLECFFISHQTFNDNIK